MDLARLFKRDLLFYRRTNLTLVALAAVCCAIVTGALLVGDSVRYSLRRISEMRLGDIALAMNTQDRLFGRDLADRLAGVTNTPVAPVLARRGILESADGTVRVNDVHIYGVDEQFWKLSNAQKAAPIELKADGVWLSRAMDERLGQEDKDWLLRFEQEAALSSELIFARDEAATRAWPVRIEGVVADDAMGRFGLTPQQQAPLNVFVPLDWLGQKADAADKANLLLVGRGERKKLQEMNTLLKQLLQPDDLQLTFKEIPSAGVIELASARIFMEDTIGQAATQAGKGGYGVLTYFVNDIRSGDRSVPYSMVSAAGALTADMKDDEIVINEWLANELKADVGSEITLTYYKPVTGRKLTQESATFKVKGVAPMMGLFADSTLMPQFPGLADAQNCRDWNAGVPIDLSRIRKQDEAYWDKYRGAPKAFVSLAAAKRIWSNRFGSLTAVRWPAKDNSIETLQADVMAKLDSEAVGFAFEDVRAAARTQSAGSSDFAGLFAGLSMFLIFSAAVLLALVFVFFVESRSVQAGLLSAVGWSRTRMVLFFLGEGAILAAGGCAAGVVISMLYTSGLVAALNATLWGRALASLELESHATVWTLLKGFLFSFVICVFAMQAGLFGRMNRPAHQLLTGTQPAKAARRRGLSTLLIMAAIFISAGVLLPFTSGLLSQAGVFFASGVLLLAGVFCMAAVLLRWMRRRRKSFARSQSMLAVRNIPRRSGRSLAVLITAACGVFLVVSVGTNHKDIGAEAQQRDSGTGGFTLIAETTLPLREAPDLSADEGLRMPQIAAGAAVAFKVYEQEDASCLNLNRVRRPTLLGVDPQELAKREAFRFQSTVKADGRQGWELLNADLERGEIAVIGDYATVYWALGKNTGDTLQYVTESGRPATLRIVGILKDSVLQGKLFVAQAAFERMFPSVEGYRLFLIDADWANRDLQAQQLSKKYRDAGMEVTTAAQTLAAFHEVENTYLAIFLVLGGLGLILGSAGVGLVLLLNVLDRKGEIAMMQAIGFRTQDLRFMLFLEHGILLAAGLLCGLVPAIVAVLPAIWTQGRAFPAMTVFLLTMGIVLSGAAWIRLAVGGVLRMNFLDELKNE